MSHICVFLWATNSGSKWALLSIFSSLNLIRDIIRSDSIVVCLEGEDLVDRWQTGRPAIMGSFFIRMYCSMPFIPDDRKLLCCQDAATEIEGRSNISIFQFESHWNELVKERGGIEKGKRGKMKKNPLLNKREQTKMSFFCRAPTPYLISFLFFTPTVANHTLGF